MTFHPAALTMYNRVPEQLDLTRQALDSLLRQDVGLLDIWLIDNGSTQPTRDWLASLPPSTAEGHLLHVCSYADNQSPNHVINEFLRGVFDLGYTYALGIPNDVILPPNLYREFLRWPRGFVTASETKTNPPTLCEVSHAVSENTPMAVMLVRRWAYDALLAKDGQFFDTGYFCYASDCDLALRMASCGMRGIQLDLSYYHFGSAHWRMLPETEGSRETDKADRDRAYFERKWGFRCDSLEYGQRATDVNFRG